MSLECTTSDLMLALVNTRPSDNGRVERFDDEAGLLRWLTEAGISVDEPVTGADVVAARELRDAFATIFRAHCGCADAPVEAAEGYLRSIAGRYPLVLRITVDGVRVKTSQTGLPGAFGTVLAAAADLSARGIWSRLKLCKNPSCYAGFFDKTKNQSGQFCSSGCGAQVSMRAYRSRIKTA
ncbi:CGNR zinc finger domain-containing protein [Kutzneria sp. CA-103260]|uniref:CGNR zinc finger domain-containing protein n=1 Tax=Kutzneria sp. CA-103260 TaxID=2802641 RepID=UPI001BAC5F66|nr:CGNR zinc finger domain-containing protein [Kutzneria sp. CA-103260]